MKLYFSALNTLKVLSIFLLCHSQSIDSASLLEEVVVTATRNTVQASKTPYSVTTRTSKAQWPHMNLTTNYYFTEINDFIASTPTGLKVDGLTQVSKRNSASGYVQGLEFALNYTCYRGCRCTVATNNLLDEAYRTHSSGSNEPEIGVNIGLELSL